MRDEQKGFTLIELMITVGIIGILASVAIPSYNGYVRRARAAEAPFQLHAMFTAAASYYHTEYVGEGLGAVEKMHCLPGTSTWQPSLPAGSEKKFGDFVSNPTYHAIGFEPPEPLLFRYILISGAGLCAPESYAHLVGIWLGPQEYTHIFFAIGNQDDDSIISAFGTGTRINESRELMRNAGVVEVSPLE